MLRYTPPQQARPQQQGGFGSDIRYPGSMPNTKPQQQSGFGNDIRYPGSMPNPQAPQPQNFQGSMPRTAGGFPPPPANISAGAFKPGMAQPIAPQGNDTSWQPDPDSYRRSIAEERARTAKKDRDLASRREDLQQNRPGYSIPGYDRDTVDPIIARNEYDQRRYEQQAIARGEDPYENVRRKQYEYADGSTRSYTNDRDLAMFQESDRIKQSRADVQKQLPQADQATQRAIRQRMSAYGETPQQAYQQVMAANGVPQMRPQMPQPTPAGWNRW